MSSYLTRFRACLLRVSDASEAETLDKFIRGLSAEVRQLVLLFRPRTFDEAATAAERAAVSRAPAV